MFSFIAIGLAVSEMFEEFYGHSGHLGHVTRIIYIHIGSHFLKMLHVKCIFDWLSGFREGEFSIYL